MKLYKYLVFILITTLTMSCNDDFLERVPESELNKQTFFSTEETLKIYNSSIYHEAGWSNRYRFLYGFSTYAWGSGYRTLYYEDIKSDNMVQNNSKTTYLEKISAGQFQTPASRVLHGWYWDLLRDINFFLENYNQATSVSKKVREQYAAEARLFRAVFYFDKVKRYGDVPWIDKTLEVDSPEAFGPRDSRELVMKNVLADINFAIEHLPDGGIDKGRYGKEVALALKSRICLHEGTFRKYHGIGSDANTWLTESANASKALMDKGTYSLYSKGNPDEDYRNLFIQDDLSGNSEVIVFKKYKAGVNGHAFTRYIKRRKLGLTKDLVDDYLCTDGKPIGLSPQYLGDETMAKELVNRDPRLRQTIVFPDNVPNQGDKDWEKYWVDYPPGLPGYEKTTWITSTGYAPHKMYNRVDDKRGYGKGEMDAIIMRYGEVLLNYAEAKAELGSISQGDLDMSVNLLRARVGMPPLNVNAALDPKYASESLSPIIIEIRRERRIELALEGFRYDDLMRWKKGEYLAKRKLGMRFGSAAAASLPLAKVKTVSVNGKVYIDPYQGTVFENRTFDPNKHYYFPIPTGQISLNPKLKQNPGW